MKNVAKIFGEKVICKEKGRYIGWPTIAKTDKGELLIVFSGDRDEHVCPWGKTEIVKSRDNGKTWTKPSVINDYPLDDRDAGIIQTKAGTLVVSWFTSIAFITHEEGCRKGYGDKTVDLWAEQKKKATKPVIKKWLGSWIRRSEDNGRTWGKPVKVFGSTPHGPIQLYDGRLLYVGKDIYGKKGELTVEASGDDGKTWSIISRIDIPKKEKLENYHEPHVVECPSGKLVAMFRYHVGAKDWYLRQSESYDGGKTWSVAHKTKIWGYPPHLICLKNGWLLVVYGRRTPEYGERGCISRDEGKTWDVENEIVISKSFSGDLGYPASVQMDDGTIWTIYYQKHKKNEKTCLMGTHWKLA